MKSDIKSVVPKSIPVNSALARGSAWPGTGAERAAQADRAVEALDSNRIDVDLR